MTYQIIAARGRHGSGRRPVAFADIEGMSGEQEDRKSPRQDLKLGKGASITISLTCPHR